jgi:hypothetical protein
MEQQTIIELTEGLPVIKHRQFEKADFKPKQELVLIDECECEHCAIPPELQKELPFLGMKGLTDYVMYAILL